MCDFSLGLNSWEVGRERNPQQTNSPSCYTGLFLNNVKGIFISIKYWYLDVWFSPWFYHSHDLPRAVIPISSSYILPVHSVACSQWVTLVGIRHHPHLFFTGAFSLAYPDAGRLVQCLLYYLSPISFWSDPYHHQETVHWDSWMEHSECWSSHQIDETNTPLQFST